MSVDLSGGVGYSPIIGKDHTHVVQSNLGELGTDMARNRVDIDRRASAIISWMIRLFHFAPTPATTYIVIASEATQSRGLTGEIASLRSQ